MLTGPPPHWRTYVCLHVRDEGRPVRSVHCDDEDGSLEVTCDPDFEATHPGEGQIALITWGEVLTAYPDLREIIPDIGPGVTCVRETTGDPWVVERPEVPPTKWTRIERLIDQGSWLVQGVAPRVGDEGPIFAYTIGLCHVGLPEILCIGLRQELMCQMLNDIGQRGKDGPLPIGEDIQDVIEGFPVRLLPVPEKKAREYACQAYYFCEDHELPVPSVLQLVYPDREGRWPWQPDINGAFCRQQPVLGDVQPEDPQAFYQVNTAAHPC